jgi:nucleotide-binding universal stress UspA family protein
MRILVAIDGSESSKVVLDNVMARPWPAGTEIKVLNVLEPPSHLMGRQMAGADPEFEMVWKAIQDQGMDLVTKAAARLRGAGLNASTLLKEGDPKSQIIDAAQDEKADMIILGSHGHTGLRRFLIGGVSEAVVRHAHCSVEIVRSQDHQEGVH